MGAAKGFPMTQSQNTPNRLPRALSIRPPHAQWIIHGDDEGRVKDIENRTWLSFTSGWVLVHAGLQDDRRVRRFVTPTMRRGGIIGAVRIIACVPSVSEEQRRAKSGYTRGEYGQRGPSPVTVEARKSRWFKGPYGFVLRDPVALPFTPCRGRLSFFDPDVSGEGRAILLEALAAAGIDPDAPPEPETPNPALEAACDVLQTRMAHAGDPSSAAEVAP